MPRIGVGRLAAVRAEIEDGGDVAPPHHRPSVSTTEPHPSIPLPVIHQLPVVAQHQGRTNACGTTALASVLSYWGQPTTHEQIDAGIRHFDLFSAPDALVGYARAHGLRAELKNGATLEDLAHMVDQGCPPMVVVDPDGSANANLHYLTVKGYSRDESGKISSVVVADSGDGADHRLSAREFTEKWSNAKLGGVGTGLTNVMISVVPNDDRQVQGADGTCRPASSIVLPTSDVGYAAESTFARGIANVTTGISMAVDTIVGFFRSIFG
jgi:Peptidase_C39 like family